jgi:hypothetical protein
MPNERTRTRGFSIPEDREEEVEEALRKMKILRPFDSFSTIIVDAIVGQAAAMDGEGLYKLYTSQHRTGENGQTPV